MKITYINKLKSGFSLIEMAIVLIIIGIVAGGVMPSLINARTAQSHQQTAKKLEHITYLVANYVRQNKNAMPCPAADLRGQEQEKCTNEEQAHGYVPYKTLGLSASSAKDALGNPITFIVQPRASQIRVCSFSESDIGSLMVYDANNQPAYDQRIAMVLIAHHQVGTSHHPAEKANKEPFGPYFSSSPPFEKKVFRDIVLPVTMPDLMAFYAKSPCRPEEKAEKKVGKAEEKVVPFKRN